MSTDFCFKSVASGGSSQCAEDTMSRTSCRVEVPPKRERELPQTSSVRSRDGLERTHKRTKSTLGALRMQW